MGVAAARVVVVGRGHLLHAGEVGAVPPLVLGGGCRCRGRAAWRWPSGMEAEGQVAATAGRNQEVLPKASLAKDAGAQKAFTSGAERGGGWGGVGWAVSRSVKFVINNIYNNTTTATTATTTTNNSSRKIMKIIK